MNGCKYKQVNGCDTCDCVFFQECKKFVIAHAAWLTRDIRPFIKSSVELHSRVVWSRDMNKAKSAAMQYAVKLNSEVVKYDLAEMVSIVMREDELLGKVFYIEIPKKGHWNADDKTLSCLNTFLCRVRMVNACCSVYLGPASGYKLDKADAEEVR